MTVADALSFRERLVIRVLLLVARIVTHDPKVAEEIRKLSNHIEYSDRGERA